jgi:hypothetical protein
MNTIEILKELEAERDRLNQAIAILSKRRWTRHTRLTRKARRAMSAAARRRISMGMKKRWAERKKTVVDEK